jgi:thiol-disulfide isomerase/thioredoxin
VSEPRDSGSGPPEELVAIRTKRRRVYLIAAFVLVVVATAAVAVAASSDPSSISGKVDTAKLPDDGPAPSVAAAAGWINSPKLTQADLKGKVVLYDFWTYSCINCVRTFPKVRAWADRYRKDGLVVIGVHSPEFDFEKSPTNVAGAVKRLHVTWPVALDPDMAVWSAFNNQYWPADYIADRAGHIRYTHFGEGDYANTEKVLRKLLGVRASAPRADEGAKAETASGESVNPETYLGTDHGQAGAESGDHTYPRGGTVTAPEAALVGRWNGEPEKITSVAGDASIVVGVRAQSVNLVLASATGAPIDAVITLDGQPVPVDHRGANVHADAAGRTVVTVTAPDMYRLVLTPGVEEHELEITAPGGGLEAYAFTFG